MAATLPWRSAISGRGTGRPAPPRYTPADATDRDPWLLAGLLLVGAAPARAAFEPAQQPGPTGGGVLRFPQAVAVDPADGAIWVADQHSFLVQRFAADRSFVRQLGGYGQNPGLLGRQSVEGTWAGSAGWRWVRAARSTS